MQAITLGSDLEIAAVSACAGIVVLLARPLGLRWALTLALLKVGVSFVYFGAVGERPWTLVDDVYYAEESAELFVQEAPTFGGLVAPGFRETLFAAAGSRHVGYFLHNLVARLLFGDHYFSPVFLNVFLTALAALALIRILSSLAFPPAYRRAAAIFFLLHWDVIAWSSFFNLKDTLVLTLTSWLVCVGMDLCRRPRFLPLLLFALVAALLSYVRFYMPVLVMGAFGLWALGHWRGWGRVAIVLGALVAIRTFGLIPGADAGYLEVTGAPAGAARFLLTPRPWGLQEAYSFLLVPSILHWFLLPAAFLGGVDLWRRFPRARFPILVLLLVALFYGSVPILQGVRQRFQMTVVLALLQFHGVHLLAAQVLGLPALAREGSLRAGPAGAR